MLASIEISNVGILKVKVLEETTDTCKVEINGAYFWIDKYICKFKLLEEEKIENNKIEGVKFMSLKEKILSKLDYRKIVEEVYDSLKGDIEERVMDQIDNSDVAESLIKNHTEEFVSSVEDLVLEEVLNDITFESVEDDFRSLVTEKLY